MEGGPAERPVIESHPFPYVVNDLGDICGRRRDDGTVDPFDPDGFGWTRPRRRLETEYGRSIEEIKTLPYFSVEERRVRPRIPGPRPQRLPPHLQWKNGAAPPAAVESEGGRRGRYVTYDRLTNALGIIARRLPGALELSPFIVHDFVGGRRFIVDYRPPPLEPGGSGTVYVLDDTDAFKIGHTNGYVVVRINTLQTGNPRLIRTVATVGSASRSDEERLRSEFAQWRRLREWFERAPLEELAADAGGWKKLLAQRLQRSSGDWDITVFPPYT